MKELKELQKKYRELGEEIEALKNGHSFYLFRKHIVLNFIEPRRSVVVKQGENCKVGDTIDFCEDYGALKAYKTLKK